MTRYCNSPDEALINRMPTIYAISRCGARGGPCHLTQEMQILWLRTMHGRLETCLVHCNGYLYVNHSIMKQSLESTG